MDPASLTPGTAEAVQSIGLDEWIRGHGPLAPAVVSLLALSICSHASRLDGRQLAAALDSIDPAYIRRTGGRDWTWTPTGSGQAVSRADDPDVIWRIGLVMFYALTGCEPGLRSFGDQPLRATLRTMRPELPATMVDLVVRALTRDTVGVTLERFSKALEPLIGIERAHERRPSGRQLGALVIGTLAVVTCLCAWWLVARAGAERLLTHGLTTTETTTVDILADGAQTLALMDEQTAALDWYLDIERIWRQRLAPTDPRFGWLLAQSAWVRAMMNDRLTAEQLFSDKPDWLAAQLGVVHPYVRAARLQLATLVEARGQAVQASGLRAQAARDLSRLIEDETLVERVMGGEPTSAGVIAHVAPNAPEREGFYVGRDGGYAATLTSAQRWMAGEWGWRLHLRADGPCRASVVVGAAPRRVGVSVAQTGPSVWTIRVDGVVPPIVLSSKSGDALGAALVADRAGTATVTLAGGATASGALDLAGAAPRPPHAFAFSGGGRTGCRVAWLEIPFPPHVPLPSQR